MTYADTNKKWEAIIRAVWREFPSVDWRKSRHGCSLTSEVSDDDPDDVRGRLVVTYLPPPADRVILYEKDGDVTHHWEGSTTEDVFNARSYPSDSGPCRRIFMKALFAFCAKKAAKETT